MFLEELKQLLPSLEQVIFQLPDQSTVPAHFHVTEIGQAEKRFIDCGGTLRTEQKITFQLWHSVDFDHRLAPAKLSAIVKLSEEKLGLGNHEIEVEYQNGDTISKYGLDFDGQCFTLTNTLTDCLAPDKCGIPAQKPRIKLRDLQQQNHCDPASGCC